LAIIGVTVLPDQRAVSNAHEAFKPDGSLADEKQAAKVKKTGTHSSRTIWPSFWREARAIPFATNLLDPVREWAC